MTDPLGTKPSTAKPLIETRSVTRSFECGRIEALRGVSFSIMRGEFVAISGPSGSGKSSLLQLLGGLDSPTSGEVLFDGMALAGGGQGALDLDTYRARHIGFIFQSFHLMPTLNAIENVQIPMLGLGLAAKARVQKAETLLREMGLGDRLRSYPNQLSGGERQRVAIARALANDPLLLLADEPTGNLDSAASVRIMEILAGIQAERGMTLVVVTHENAIACSASRHIRMRDGRIDASVAAPVEVMR